MKNADPSGRQRRSIRGMFVRPRAQLRQAYLLAAVAGIAITIIGMINTIMNARMLNNLSVLYRIDSESMDDARRIMLLGMALLLIVGLASVVVMFAYAIMLGHRFFGPLVPLNAHLEKLMSGDYSSRVHLRQGDELHELAQKLNELAAKLESKSSP